MRNNEDKITNMYDVYDVELIVKGPLHIGDGKKISKIDYLMKKNEKRLLILDLEKMYNKNENYFKSWIENTQTAGFDIENFVKYELECNDDVNKNDRNLQIRSFIKDVYEKPYIPGSSLKGMLRTVLLAYDIKNNKENYKDVIEKMRKDKQFEKKINTIEEIAFNILNRDDKKKNNKVNDVLAGIRISDSESLEWTDLILCQKKDVLVNGKENNISTYAESLRPGTVVKFTLTLDKMLCKYENEYIISAIKNFEQLYNEMFINKFNICQTNDLKSPNNEEEIHVWLGGGVGFISKTVICSLFDNDSLEITRQILHRKFRQAEHLKKDITVSPRAIKLTSYNNNLYQFGECIFRMQKRDI